MNEEYEFFSLGGQYYVAGRAAALAGLQPVCGNLFHHAIEMLLKARLSQKCSTMELKATRHSLSKAWSIFKQQFPGVDLSRFDIVISELDPFENIRYPDSIIKEGAKVHLEWQRSHVIAAPVAPSANGTGECRVVVNDVDALVAEIFKVCHRHPRFYIRLSQQYGVDAVRQDNPVGASLLA